MCVICNRAQKLERIIMFKRIAMLLMILMCISFVQPGITAEARKKSYVTKASPRNTFKSYMDYRCIRSRSSMQYKLQRKAVTNKKNGLRMINGRYCIALGSYYTRKIGAKVDLVMSSGKVVKCITADMKADRDTINNHRQHPDGSVAEFVVDTRMLSKKVRRMGDVSYTGPFKGSIKKIRIYK